jgi:hypothetical protein
MWGSLMAGGSGFHWYLGFEEEKRDLRLEDFRRYDFLWAQSGHAIRFFEQYGSGPQFEPQTGLTREESQRVLAEVNQTYMVYLPQGGTAELNVGTGTYSVSWYNPRAGGGLQTGTVATVSGPGWKGLGQPPGEATKDWVVLVHKDGTPGGGNGGGGGGGGGVTATFASSVGDDGLMMRFDGSESATSSGTITGYQWDFGDGSTGAGRNVSHRFEGAGSR